MRHAQPTTNKYILYLRKSTDREDSQTLSIPGQEETCMAFARQNNLLVVGKIVEKVSAKAPGRPLFNQMMRQISEGKANSILAYHPNRLARNSRDGGEIVYWLDTGALADLKFPTFWFESTAQGKYMISLEFAQSKRYSDDLAIVTKRGIDLKCKAGYFPNRAPLGYLNDRRTRTIVFDPKRAPIIKAMLEHYAQGTSTIEDLRRLFCEQFGKCSGRALPVSRQNIQHMLNNPFYYGAFRYAGKLYQGKHKPLISKRLFDRIAAVRQTRWRPHIEKASAAFTGLMRCGGCGVAITSDLQRGHLYYRCTRKSKKVVCKEPYIREENLRAELSALLSSFNMAQGQAHELETLLATEEKTTLQTATEALRKRNRNLDAVQDKINRLLESYLDRTISSEIYTGKQRELFSEQQTILEDIREIEANPTGWLEPFRQWISKAQNMDIIAKTGSTFEQKTMLAEIFGSNLFLERKKPCGRAVKPWSFIAKSERLPTTVDVFALARTFFMESLGKPVGGGNGIRTAGSGEAERGSEEPETGIEPVFPAGLVHDHGLEPEPLSQA